MQNYIIEGFIDNKKQFNYKLLIDPIRSNMDLNKFIIITAIKIPSK